MSDLFDTRNVGSVIKIIREDGPSKRLVLGTGLDLIDFPKGQVKAVEISFQEGSLPKKGHALTLCWKRNSGSTGEVPISTDLFEDISEVPVVLEVSEILNKNLVSAIIVFPPESVVDLIDGLSLGIQVIDSGRSLLNHMRENFQQQRELLDRVFEKNCIIEIEDLRLRQVDRFNSMLLIASLEEEIKQRGYPLPELPKLKDLPKIEDMLGFHFSIHSQPNQKPFLQKIKITITITED